MALQHFFEDRWPFPCIRVNNVGVLSVSGVPAVQISRHQFPEGQLLTTFLGYSDELPFLVNDQDRLNIHDSADNGGSSGNASSALQVHEVLHHKYMADFVAHFLEIGCICSSAHSVLFIFNCQLRKQSHPACCRQSIDRIYFCVRVFFIHIHLGDPHTVKSLCQSARQGQIDNRFTLRKMLLKDVYILLRGNLACVCEITCPLSIVKFLQEILVFHTTANSLILSECVSHRYKKQFIVPEELLAHIGGCISVNDIIFHSYLPFIRWCAFHLISGIR